MKLLFDENLSFRLVAQLADLYSDSTHVRDVGLASASDEDVWSYATAHGFTIVSKDADFHQRSFLEGSPPKVIWIQRGNCTTQDIVDLFHTRAGEISSFLQDEEAAFLALL